MLQPTLETPRLLLQPLQPDHAEALHRLAADRAIADTMVSIPHPLRRETVDAWIARASEDFARRAAASFATIRREDEQLVGYVALRHIDAEHELAEISFWTGRPFWGLGYTSEAGRRLVRYGFDNLGINRIYAYHMVRNPASGRVCEKLGMQPEGVLRQRVKKWDVYEDVVIQAVLRGSPEFQDDAELTRLPP